MWEINPWRFFWSLADQAKFSKWTSPYMVMLLNEGSSVAYGSFASLTFDRLFNFNWYAQIFRLDVFKQIGLEGRQLAALLGFSIWFGISKKLLKPSAILYLKLLAILIVALSVNSLLVRQEVSITRMFEFSLYLIPVLCFMILPPVFGEIIRSKYIAMLLAMLLLFSWDTYRFRLPHKAHLFLTGQVSNVALYKEGKRFLENVFKVKYLIGNDKRIFSFHTTHGEIGLVPGERIETEIDYSYKQWHRFAFSAADEAKEALRIEGLDYFLIDFSFFKEYAVTSLMLSSPLFQIENLKKHFTIAAASGSAYILTWKNSGDAELPEAFVEFWKSVKIDKRFVDLADRINHYHSKYGENYPIYSDPSLPAVKGWQ